MYGAIAGFHFLLRCPKCTPASKSSLKSAFFDILIFFQVYVPLVINDRGFSRKLLHHLDTKQAPNKVCVILTFRELEFLTSSRLTWFLTLYHSWITCH